LRPRAGRGRSASTGRPSSRGRGRLLRAREGGARPRGGTQTGWHRTATRRRTRPRRAGRGGVAWRVAWRSNRRRPCRGRCGGRGGQSCGDGTASGCAEGLAGDAMVDTTKAPVPGQGGGGLAGSVGVRRAPGVEQRHAEPAEGLLARQLYDGRGEDAAGLEGGTGCVVKRNL